MAQAAPPPELYVIASWMVLEGSMGDENSGPVPRSDLSCKLTDLLRKTLSSAEVNYTV